MRTLTALAFCSALAATTSSAHAQSTTTPAQPDAVPMQRDPACPPGVGRNPPTVGSGGHGNLSDQLAESKGVICPPHSADKEMAVPPPQGGTMKVIPPPGTPGGDQILQPK